jgi:hypothetical protein
MRDRVHASGYGLAGVVSTVALAVAVLAISGCTFTRSASRMADRVAQRDVRRESASASATTAPAPAPSPYAGIRTIDVKPSLAPHDTSLSGLVMQTDMVVRGTVTDVRFVVYRAQPRTITTVRVTQSWTPGVSVGETVTVFEEGGVWSRAEEIRALAGEARPVDPVRITPADEATKTMVTIMGTPLPEVGQDSIYLLEKSRDGFGADLAPNLYFVVHLFEGKYRVSRGMALRHWPRDFGANPIPAASVASLSAELSRYPQRKDMLR